MNEITVRAAVAADAEAAAEIARECWSDIYDGYLLQLGEELYSLIYDDPLSVKAERIRDAVLSGRAFVAICEEEICGFATYLAEGKEGALKDNAVSAKYKGRGIAKMLYEAVFEKLRSEGCAVCRVGTGLDEAHAPARRAYEKAGFEKSLQSVTYFKKL